MISALIFSMNRVENVVRLAEKIRPYVDEIVIVDSSNKKNRKILEERLKDDKIRIYWFPPAGIVELYYEIGLELCSNEWVIHIEDDEDPSEDLLMDLRTLIEKFGEKYKIFRVLRGSKKKQRIFRIFNKNYIIPTGVIHWTWAAKTNEILDLEEKYFIHHPDYLSLRDFIKTFRKYAVVESYQYGYKILATIYKDFIGYQNPKSGVSQSVYRKIFKKFFEGTLRFSRKISFMISVTLYNLYLFFVGVKGKEPLRAFLYALFIQYELMRSFGKKYEIWLRMWEEGDPIKYAGMDSVENFNKIAEKLDPENGLKNFVALMERKV